MHALLGIWRFGVVVIRYDYKTILGCYLRRLAVLLKRFYSYVCDSILCSIYVCCYYFTMFVMCYDEQVTSCGVGTYQRVYRARLRNEVNL